MDLASILHQIDAELTKLQRIREIVQGLAGSGQQSSLQKPRNSMPTAVPPSLSTSAPELVILPPKERREYRSRLKPLPTVVRALGPAPSDRPVFVPRASVPFRAEQDRGLPELHLLEAAVRQNLLGGVA